MSIEYIDALNVQNSVKKYAIVDLEDLCLDKRNPRFSSSTIIGNKREIQEIDIIAYLLQFGRIVELAESINRNCGLYDEEWVSCCKNDEGKLVVLEGNRRIAACKILLDPSLVSEKQKADFYIPSADKDLTISNISKVRVIIYEKAEDAQNYIAAKHTKQEVKKWETIEQCNYYYEQFSNRISSAEISQRVGEDIKKVREKIKNFGIFKEVFDVVKEKYPNLLIEDINILPLVTKFMPPIIATRGEVALKLSYDEEKLSYSARPDKVEIYKKILLKIGEAFFVRPKLHSGYTSERNCSATYRISTDEIKTKSKVEKIIIDNIRIPGLYDLINEYRENEKIDACEEQLGNLDNKDDADKSKSIGVDIKQNNGGSDTANYTVRLPEFFADINFSHINLKDYPGIVLVCEEIQKMSIYNGGSAYKQFPISASFLLRSLIEQVLSERLKQVGRYNSMVKILKDGSSRSPELGAVIAVFLNDYKNKNMMLFWNDGNLGREFNKCFSGYGTKDQLDTIIHNPHLIQPDQNFLNSLSKQGLKLVIQGFLNQM